MTPRPRRTTRANRPLATSPFVRKVVVPQTTADFEVGDRVTLDSYGMGRVVKITEEYVVVDFGSGEPRHVPAATPGFTRL